jgi:hypothetical protein
MAYRRGRGRWACATTAALIGRASPAPSRSVAAPYRGNLSRAPQVASVANSHAPARSEMRPRWTRLSAATITPGIIKKRACPTGTVQGKSRPLRKYHPTARVVTDRDRG